MKLNLKSTIAAPAGQTLNGIVGNTRRGIVVDKTLDSDSNNPVANKPVSTALAALAGELAKGQVVFLDQLPESGEPHKIYVLTETNQRYWWDGSKFIKIVPTASEITQTFVSNATALTDGKIAKTSIVGGDVNKCKIGDIVLVADGGVYKIKAIDETNITLVVPALVSDATASACIIKIDSEKRTYTSNIPLPTDESIPVYADFEGALYPLVYEYQNSASGHNFELWDYIPGEAVIRVGCLTPDGTVEISMDNSSSLLTAPLPDTLDKSYLIGVGTYGEEVIEIGDNLTLIDGVLSATSGSGGSGGSSGGSSGVSGNGVNLLQATIEQADEYGNPAGTYTGTMDPHKVNIVILQNIHEAKYALLTNITDEGVGSATITAYDRPMKLSLANNEIHRSTAGTYLHCIFISNDTVNINFNYYSTYGHRYLVFEELQEEFRGKFISCSGFVKINNKFKNARYLNYNTITYFDNDTGKNADIDLTGTIDVEDHAWCVETGMEMDTHLDPQ